MFLLGLDGCGYKGRPFYTKEAPKADKNVKFIIKKQSVDTNQTQENSENCK